MWEDPAMAARIVQNCMYKEHPLANSGHNTGIQKTLRNQIYFVTTHIVTVMTDKQHAHTVL